MTLPTTLEKSVAMLCVSASSANALTANIYAGRSNDTIEVPCVVVAVETAEELIRHSGVWKCQMTIQTQERASVTSPTSSFTQPIWEAIGSNDVIGKLTAYSTGSLMIHNLDAIDLKTTIGTDDKTWIQEATLEIISALT